MGLTPKYHDSGVQFTEIYCISLIMISVQRFVVLQDSYLVHVSPGKKFFDPKMGNYKGLQEAKFVKNCTPEFYLNKQ